MIRSMITVSDFFTQKFLVKAITNSFRNHLRVILNDNNIVE